MAFCTSLKICTPLRMRSLPTWQMRLQGSFKVWIKSSIFYSSRTVHSQFFRSATTIFRVSDNSRRPSSVVQQVFCSKRDTTYFYFILLLFLFNPLSNFHLLYSLRCPCQILLKILQKILQEFTSVWRKFLKELIQDFHYQMPNLLIKEVVNPHFYSHYHLQIL